MALTLDGTNGIVSSGSITTQSATGVIFSDSSSLPAASSPYVLKNRIINGAMQVWQRGTSITTGGAYTADRWTEVSGNSNQHIQSTDAPTNFGYSMQIIGVAANMNQRIESLNCQDLSGQTVTVSFWVKNTSGTDSLVAALYYANTADNFGSLTQIGSSVTISSNPSSSWTQYTTTFTNLPSGSKNGLSLYLARTGTGAVSTTWYLTGVQLEVGTSATPFERRLYNQELANCQRYCVNYRSADSGSPYFRYGVGQCETTTTMEIVFPYPVPMRVLPTLTTTGTAANYGVYHSSVVTALSSVPTINNSSSYLNATINGEVASGLTQGRACALLSNNNNTSYLLFSAEL
jgi:hypothetical protein